MQEHNRYERPAGGKIIADLVAAHPGKGHPRIIFTNDSLGLFQVGVDSNPYMAEKWKHLKIRADEYLTQAPVVYFKEGHRLLRACKKVSDSVLTLSIAYHITGNTDYARRLWEELNSACTVWPDWNPYHFLDTGEMAMAIAVAYDWLYDYWTNEQRTILEKAIMERAIIPILQDYLDLPRERASGTGKGWLGYQNNWSFVCTGSVMTAALAICDEKAEYLERCALVLGMGIRELEGVLATYAPDGGFIEGPAYWGYANTYLAYSVSALISATGKDYGLLNTQGLKNTAYFNFDMLGPGGTFNFSDAAPGYTVYPECLWFARQYKQPALVSLYRKVHDEWGYGEHSTSVLIRELLFYPPELEHSPCVPSLESYYRRVETVTLRDTWDMDNGYFLGLHAGENGISHYHMDCGSFVLDMHGKRFALDLGAGTYNEPGLWFRYRYSAQGHNTWIINPDERESQNPNAKTTIIRHDFDKKNPYAIADISDAYDDVVSLQRGVTASEERKVFLVQDEIKTVVPANCFWQMHTAADIEILEGGKQAVLTIGDDCVLVSLLTGNDALFEIHSAWPLEGTPYYPVSDSDREISKLILHFDALQDETVAVEFRHFSKGEKIPKAHLSVKPLQLW